MIILIPTSEKELKKAAPAISFFLKKWLIIYLIVNTFSVLTLQLTDKSVFSDNLLGVLIIGFLPINTIAITISFVWMLIKFKKK